MVSAIIIVMNTAMMITEPTKGGTPPLRGSHEEQLALEEEAVLRQMEMLFNVAFSVELVIKALALSTAVWPSTTSTRWRGHSTSHSM